MIRVIAKRYAKALLELSEEKKITDQSRCDLAAFVCAVDSQQDVKRLFMSPAITAADKKAVIGELATRLKLNPVTRRFIEHLAESSRIRHVREVQQAFEDLLAERQNRAAVVLTTAQPVNNGDIAEIKKRLESLTGKDVDIDAKIDPSLIGGARAQIGSVIYDGSIKNQLEKMRSLFVK